MLRGLHIQFHISSGLGIVMDFILFPPKANEKKSKLK